MADRLHLDYNKMLEEAESHSNDPVEAQNLFVVNSLTKQIKEILEDYEYYISKELTPRISGKLIQLYDFKKFNDEITPIDDDDEQEKPVKRNEKRARGSNPKF
ncbi:MAG: hypothetical protein EZS28_016196 [Streblomastix strix]|uniref:Uncharacterized protein n=1 Tax=Streblomastix strix TaxID=222440 RepID=A0A5J4W182_9EUKA|nr:MAG: hypothetical protein EZS28_016196 [Streblomastix strix]